MEYTIIFSVQAQKLFTEIKDRREQSVILKRIEKLKDEPEKQGKALSEELLGYLFGLWDSVIGLLIELNKIE